MPPFLFTCALAVLQKERTQFNDVKLTATYRQQQQQEPFAITTFAY